MRVPKYRRHTLRDFAFIEYQGERIRLPGTYDSAESRAAYHDFLKEHVYAASPPPQQRSQAGRRQTVADVCHAFLDWAKIRHPPGHRSEFGNLRQAVKWLVRLEYSKLFVDEFGPLCMKQIQRTMAAEGRKRGYINDTCRRIRRIFKWAVSEELVPVEVYQRLLTVDGLRAGETTAPEPTPKRPVAWEDVKPILKHLAPPVAAMCQFQWYTGARGDSIVNAMAGQFTDRDGDVWLWKPKHKEQARFELILPIGPKCQKIIQPFMENQPYLFSPQLVRQNARYGLRYTASTYRQAVIRAQEKAGVTHWTPHQLRHGIGNRVRDKHGAEAAQAMLGHASLDATQLYSQRRLELAKRIALEEG